MHFLQKLMFYPAIYYGNDLIGVVQDSTNVSFTRDFVFV